MGALYSIFKLHVAEAPASTSYLTKLTFEMIEQAMPRGGALTS